MYHKKHKFIFHVRPRRKEHLLPKTKGILLSKAIEGFTLACSARRLSSHTMDDYCRTLKKFLFHAGDMPINQIGSSQISAFLSVQTVGKKTLLNYHIGLSALWTWALREEYVDKHVLRNVERPKPSQNVIEPFSEVEVRALLSAVHYAPDRNRALILLLLDTGARVSEICGLNKGDIDLVNRRIKVTGKGDKQRLIPFSPRTGSAMFSHLATCEGQPFSTFRTSVAQYLRRLGNRAGVKKTHPHRFRHTFAITFLRNNGNPYVLQEILGHSTMDMVRRYIALAQVDIDQSHVRASPVENWKL